MRSEDVSEVAVGRYGSLLQALSDLGEGCVVSEADRVVYANDAACAITGYSASELLALRSPWELVVADEQERLAERPRGDAPTDHYETAFRHKRGHRVDIEVAFKALPALGQTVAVFRDISERKRVHDLLAAEGRCLVLVASGAPLEQVLEQLCRELESLSPGTLASVLLADGSRLRHGAAPSLPASYVEAVDGIEIGPAAGSCGTAAHRREQVIVSDIETDPLWGDYRELARPHGLRACWSTPIIDSDGGLLGTFALYYRGPRSPEPADLELVERATFIAAIAIRHERARAELQASEERYRALSEMTSDWMYALRIGDDGSVDLEWVTEAFERMTGFADADLRRLGWKRLVHPDDMPIALRQYRNAMAAASSIAEFRILTTSGEPCWISQHTRPQVDASGRVVRVYGAGQDITGRKRAGQALQQHREELRVLSRRLVEVQELERRTVARELHDDVGQLLTGAKLTLERAIRSPDSVDVCITRARELIGEVIARVREMSLVLRPPMLDDLGLRAALEWHVRTFATGLGLDVTFAHSGLERRFDPGIEIAVYRIVQEAVINVGRHAGVQHAAVRIAAAEGVLRLEICDAGAGFDTSGVSPTSSGLTGMRERVEAVGGSFAVESAPGAGTRISADIPIAGP